MLYVAFILSGLRTLRLTMTGNHCCHYVTFRSCSRCPCTWSQTQPVWSPPLSAASPYRTLHWTGRKWFLCRRPLRPLADRYPTQRPDPYRKKGSTVVDKLSHYKQRAKFYIYMYIDTSIAIVSNNLCRGKVSDLTVHRARIYSSWGSTVFITLPLHWLHIHVEKRNWYAVVSDDGYTTSC